MTREERQALINEQWNRLHEAEGKLKGSDYIASKIAEGKATAEEYAEQIALRQSWRDEINAAADEIDRLESIELEDEEQDEQDL